jgi:uncharacterized protein YbdZ (MbtH family)
VQPARPALAGGAAGCPIRGAQACTRSCSALRHGTARVRAGQFSTQIGISREQPLRGQDGAHIVLVNSEGQHSLWPSFAEIPAGWTAAFGEADRAACLKYIEESWTDMRPNSLVEAMAAASQVVPSN